MKRRNFISAGILSGAGVMISKSLSAKNQKRKRVLKVGHVTDMHIFPDPVPEMGIKQLMDELNSLTDKPDFILNTGDNIMDSLEHSKEEVDAQWKAWESYFRSQLQYKLYNCIGNHDVWGWGIKENAPMDDLLYGKAWALRQLQLKSRYYSFVQAGWKFICLDSVAPATDGHSSYIAKLDKEQFSWLKEELASTPAAMPICIVSHIPILSSSVFFDGENEKSGNWQVPGAWMHIDARSLKDLFQKYQNIKLAISGHVHLVDQVNYLNVRYLCNGAACGGWWGGNYQEFAPAYAMFDFYDDGSFDYEMFYYNWK